MYEQLLISEGGGLRLDHLKVDQNLNKTNLFIGLGGQGKICLETLKAEMYRRVHGDDPAATIPTYSGVKFLYIDTDRLSVNLDKEECFFLYSSGAYDFMTDPKVLEDPAYTWLRTSIGEPGEGINVDEESMRWYTMKHTTRLLLFRQIDDLKERLIRLLTELREARPNASVVVHLCGGLCGGTGSGLLLDVCYLLRHIAEEESWENMALNGYFFLPDVALLRSYEEQRASILSTGYATMKELDYYMSGGANRDHWKQNYGKFTIESKHRPVDYAFLIGARDEDGVVRAKRPADICKQTAEYMMRYLVKPQEGRDITSFLSSARTFETHTRKEYMVDYVYLTLGMQSIRLPMEDVVNYGAALIFEKFDKITRQHPSEADIVAFMKKNKLDYDEILRELRHGVYSIPSYEAMFPSLFGLVMNCVNGEQLYDTLDKAWEAARSEIAGDLEANKRALLDDLNIKAVLSTGTTYSLINRLFSKLIGFVTDYDKGPFYAAAFLHPVKTKDIKAYIDGMIHENHKILGLLMTNRNQADNDFGDAFNDFKNSNVLNRKRRATKLTEAIYRYFKLDGEIKILQTMTEILTTFKKQVEELYSDYFKRMEIVLCDLQNTFAKNKQTLLEASDTSIIGLQDENLREAVVASVDQLSPSETFASFMDNLITTDDWPVSEDALVGAVDRFMEHTLYDWCCASGDHYFSIKFKTEKPDELLEKMTQLLSPCLDNKIMFFAEQQNGQTPTFDLIEAPYDSPLTQAVLQEYKNQKPIGSCVDAITTGVPDRINRITYRFGVPMMWYYQLPEMMQVPPYVGRFLYEGTERDGRAPGKQHRLIPPRAMPPYTPNDLERKEMVLRAIDFGVLTCEQGDEDKFFLVAADADALGQQVEQIDRMIRLRMADSLYFLLGQRLPAEVMEKIDSPTAALTTKALDGALRRAWPIAEKTAIYAWGGWNLSPENVLEDLLLCNGALFKKMRENLQLVEQHEQVLRRAVAFLSK